MKTILKWMLVVKPLNGHRLTMPNAMHNFELLFFRVEIQHSERGKLNRFRIRIICLFFFSGLTLQFSSFPSPKNIHMQWVSFALDHACGFTIYIDGGQIELLWGQQQQKPLAIKKIFYENLPSRRIPILRHFRRRQYWHWFLWCWSIGQFRLPRHVYVRFRRTERLKNDLQPEKGIERKRGRKKQRTWITINMESEARGRERENMVSTRING